MTTPEKDHVLDASVENDAGAAAQADAVTTEAAGSESAAPAAEAAEAVEAEVIEPAAQADAGAEAAQPAAPSESELVAQAQAEVAEWKDKYLRLHAEWDTYRRRMNEQREAEKALATEKLVTSLLPVLDDFERTIAYANDNGEAGLLSGV